MGQSFTPFTPSQDRPGVRDCEGLSGYRLHARGRSIWENPHNPSHRPGSASVAVLLEVRCARRSGRRWSWRCFAPPAGARPIQLPAAGAAAPETDLYGPPLQLGLVAGAVTLCTRRKPDAPRGAGCWTVNPTTGALTATAATDAAGAQPGRRRRCRRLRRGVLPAGQAEDGAILLWATSTNGTRTALLSRGDLHVFDTASKAKLRTIPLFTDGVPPHTIVGNARSTCSISTTPSTSSAPTQAPSPRSGRSRIRARAWAW